MGLSILHKRVVILLQEEVGIPGKARVLIDRPTHFPSVRVAITNIAVIRTYFTESPLELVGTGAGKFGSPPMPGAGATILAGIWPACRSHCGAVWTPVRVFTGTVIVGRTLSNDTFTPATWIVLALVLHILTPFSRERGWAAAREGVPTDKAVSTMFTGVGQAWVVLCVVPVRILSIGSGTTGGLLWVVLLIAVLIVIRSPDWVQVCAQRHQGEPNGCLSHQNHEQWNMERHSGKHLCRLRALVLL